MLVPLRPEVSSAYRVPKYEVSVEIALRGQSPERVTLFLGDRAPGRTGFERPSDLLCAEEAFIPVRAQGNQTQLVRKGAIVWLRVAAEVELQGRVGYEHDLSADELEGVEVLLEDGSVLVGEVPLALPDGRKRIQDFLNAADAFFELRTDASFVFVNRDQVIAVKPRE